MISADPVLGVGPGTYRLRYDTFAGLATGTATHANNMYLEIAAETGLIGLIAFLAVVVVGIAPLAGVLARRRVTSSAGDPLAARSWLALAAMLAAVVAFLGHGLIDYFLAFNPTNGLWWATLGLAAAVAAPRVLGDITVRDQAA